MPLVKLPRGTLLVFTDGLTDSISGKNPESRLSDALADTPGRTMSNLKSLVDPKLNADDLTIFLVTREASEEFVGFVRKKRLSFAFRRKICASSVTWLTKLE